jgi:beta-glucanase (GH16 family)
MGKIGLLVPFLAILFTSCVNSEPSENKNVTEVLSAPEVIVQANQFVNSSSSIDMRGEQIPLSHGDWLSYEINIPADGRYRIEIKAIGDSATAMWIEDYIDNTDNRTYNITGRISCRATGLNHVDGSPLRKGIHRIKAHAEGGKVELIEISFTLLLESLKSSDTLVQKMDGQQWKLVWSDEFEQSGLPDTTRWSYNIGNWGWGNNELQYYTEARMENVRQENGYLVIEARKNDMGYPWTSTRLTTQGKVAFVYGKIEFRAKVPVGRGTWAAGWLLGDAYVDEKSWPYCGEIDVLECVGFEINDTTGNGWNHASCHTRAYYFKQNNQITAQIPVENMNAEWHTYSIEWYPDVIYAYVDGIRYYTYDKNANELEWPFATPQNIILNLAVGGGWGGAHGVDEKWVNHHFLIDYVRVFEAIDTTSI